MTIKGPKKLVIGSNTDHQASNKKKYNGVISKKVSGIIEKHKNDKLIKKEDKKWSKNTKDTFKKTLNDPKVTAEAVKIFNKNNKNII